MRPEQLYGTGPDNLWTLTPTQNAVVELKTGVDLASGGIAKKDADQLRGGVQWNTEKNPDAAGVPVMLHPTDVLDEKAITVPGMRVITPAKLIDLKTAIEGFAQALTQGHRSWSAEQAVAQQLATYRLTGDRIITTFSVTARRPA